MKNFIQKMAIALSACGILATASLVPAYAVGNSMPKANGAYGYTIGGLQRYATFDVHQTTNTCIAYDVTGSYVITFGYNSGSYPHDASLTQTGSSVLGTGGYPAGGPYQYTWHVTSGSVTGNQVSLTVAYDTGATGTTMHMTGTIANDGSLSGIWDDNFGGTRTGTWTAPAGSAHVSTGCTGKGMFTYIDVNGTFYTVEVKYVSVVGNAAYFAGHIVAGNFGDPSQWLFVKVVDNGEPGINHDVTAGDYPLTEAQAKLDVATHATPSTSAIINSGNIQVH